MRLYHLSESNLNNKILHPRVPNNYMTKHGFEENKIARVCFSNSINGCLIAMGSNVKDKIFIVHEPITYDIKIISNDEIISKNYVPDAHITGETWVLEPIKIKAVGIIKVEYAKDKPIMYSYGDSKTAELYDWKFRKIPFILNK